jgi:hypothetical protein
MVATLLPDPPPTADARALADPTSAPQGPAPPWLEVPPGGDDPAAGRRRKARDLAAALGGRRAALEELRSGFLRRLHRASDDFDATEGLRVTELALRMTPRSPGGM